MPAPTSPNAAEAQRILDLYRARQIDSAFEALARCFYPVLTNRVRRGLGRYRGIPRIWDEREDLVHDLLENIHQKLSSAPDLDRITDLLGWILKRVDWRVKDLLGKMGVRNGREPLRWDGDGSGDWDPAVDGHAPGPVMASAEGRVVGKSFFAALRACVQSLDAKHGAVFWLWMEDVDLKESARRMDEYSSFSGVAKARRRIVERLRACLRAKGWLQDGE